MARRFIYFTIILAFCFCDMAFCLEKENHGKVKKFITVFKSGHKEDIVKLFEYPLYRDYPLTQIKNEKEFLIRFNEVFDSKISNLIKNSDIKKWHELGWRGIMFNGGDLWMDYDGKIRSVNYISDFEKSKREKIIEKIKNGLHISLRNFKEPVLHWKTKRFRVRIDNLGNYKYRYAAWYISRKPSEKPNLILYNGELIADGSGGNHYYIFKNGLYEYECSINVLGESETPPVTLSVSKNGKVILYESKIEVLEE